ncbi:MAG: hypothetical protein AMXMBFR52_03230 [Burkholderiales bacterium]
MNPTTQQTLDSIAYVAWHGHELVEECSDRVMVAQPGKADLLNYVGTVHAGALFTLAETAGGVLADRRARPLGCFILLRSATIHYLRRATGRLAATAGVDAEAAAACEPRPGTTDPMDLRVRVRIHDASDQAVFDGQFHYVMRPHKP